MGGVCPDLSKKLSVKLSHKFHLHLFNEMLELIVSRVRKIETKKEGGFKYN